jgi:tRNA (cytidine/uridine-2'-O-)-methyltransferase
MSPLKIVLVAPRIPANVGNIARTCLALGAELHMVGPFGFSLDEKTLKRYSVGYFEESKPKVYVDPKSFWTQFTGGSIYFATKNGEEVYSDIRYESPSWLVFGNEEEGVSPDFWKPMPELKIVSCRIPTVSVRCLNLSVSVGVIGFEVQRQWNETLIQRGVG